MNKNKTKCCIEMLRTLERHIMAYCVGSEICKETSSPTCAKGIITEISKSFVDSFTKIHSTRCALEACIDSGSFNGFAECFDRALSDEKEHENTMEQYFAEAELELKKGNK